MVCFAQKRTIGERISEVLAGLCEAILPLPPSINKTYVVTCTAAVEGVLRGVVAVVRAVSEVEAVSRLERECQHALFHIQPRLSETYTSHECWLLVDSGFIAFWDLPAALRYRVEFPHTGYVCFVNADCAASAALVVRYFSGAIADGPAVVKPVLKLVEKKNVNAR